MEMVIEKWRGKMVGILDLKLGGDKMRNTNT